MNFVTGLDIAKNLIGVVKKISDDQDNPFILWCLSLCDISGNLHDKIPWCSAAINGIAVLAGLPRSYSASARSWLKIGAWVLLQDAIEGNDIVIIKCGNGVQPGPEVLNAPGHVGWYAGHNSKMVSLVGGNQNDCICEMQFPIDKILGVRRLA